MKRSFLLLLLLLPGCAHPAPSASHSTNYSAVTQVNISNGGRISPADRSGITPTHNPGDVVVGMDILTMTVPLGGISQNAEFWKRVDEDHLDITTHDQLLRNGLRYGIAPAEEWSRYFKPIFDSLSATSKPGSWTPASANNDELLMNSGVDFQDLFFIDRAGQIKGRVYQQCDNLFTVSFEPIPNRPDQTRIRLAAVVRDRRYIYNVTAMNQPVTVERVRPEVLYDLDMEAEVPFDHFLIVAPSQVDLPFNIGRTFMIHDGKAGQVETVLVFVPKPYYLKAPPPESAKHPVAPVAR